MRDDASKSGRQDIVVDEVFPHAPETIWKTLTTGELIGRWLMMTPTGFEPVKGKYFTFQTTSAGAWDEGRFAGNHLEFHAAVRARSAPGQVPDLRRFGRVSSDFERARPFGVA